MEAATISALAHLAVFVVGVCWLVFPDQAAWVMKRPRKPRQTVTFTAEQMGWLVGEAERLGVSLSEVVRRLVEGARVG